VVWDNRSRHFEYLVQWMNAELGKSRSLCLKKDIQKGGDYSLEGRK
jgi:hypothetical protein